VTITPELVISLIYWVSQATGQPLPNAVVHISPVDPIEMSQIACPLQVGQIMARPCPALGMYEWHTQTIYIASWLPESQTKAFLVHEIKHWFQDQGGIDGPISCSTRKEIESEAYDLQNRYIREVLLENWRIEAPLIQCMGDAS
jgi:hypothetical protein